MERLTTRLLDGGARRNCDSCEMQKNCGPYDCLQRMVNRLASYEDTELSPEEIEDLASVREISPEAEYAINAHADSIIERLDKLLKKTDEDARINELAAADKEGRVLILPCKRGDRIYICSAGSAWGFWVDDVSTLNGRTVLNVHGFGTIAADEIGKTAFLSLEEAERALEELKNV